MRAPYGGGTERTKGADGGARSRRRVLAGLMAAVLVPGGARGAVRAIGVLGDEGDGRAIRIMALGDSLTAGYGLPHADGFVAKLQAALDAAHANATVLDAGVSGDTSAGGLARLDWALGDKPDAAIVELGANDGLRGLDPGQMERNLSAILDKLAARHIPVLLSGMYAPPNLGESYGRAFRAVFERLSKRPGILFDPFFLDGVALHRELNQGDGMHPNAQGVDIIVRRMLPEVLELVAEARSQGN